MRGVWPNSASAGMAIPPTLIAARRESHALFARISSGIRSEDMPCGDGVAGGRENGGFPRAAHQNALVIQSAGAYRAGPVVAPRQPWSVGNQRGKIDQQETTGRCTVRPLRPIPPGMSALGDVLRRAGRPLPFVLWSTFTGRRLVLSATPGRYTAGPASNHFLR